MQHSDSAAGPAAPTARSTLRRHRERAAYARAKIAAILDEALVCHVGFTSDTGTFVIPTVHARVGSVVYIHGAGVGRMARDVSSGIEICLTVTLLDGLVMAASWFGHSMNYRSVMVLGRARLVSEAEEKRAALRALVEHVAQGRADDARPPTRAELKATAVLALELTEASAKVRTGPPQDPEVDHSYPVWTGEIPLRLTSLEAVTGPDSPDIAIPGYAKNYGRPAR
ncbi:MAG: pyridoxamine 5'-phosphate oxidase family protein [Candidatus Dormibacteria bacterium]